MRRGSLALRGCAWVVLLIGAARAQDAADRSGHIWLGISVRDLDAASKKGLEVTGVEPGGPCALAGLRVGDVIVRVDGAVVADRDEFARRVQEEHRPGDRARFTVARAEGEKTFDVELRARRDDPDSEGWVERIQGAAPSWLRGRPQLGADVVPVDPELAAQFKAPRPNALLLTHVEEGGPAQRAGLMAGDLLLRIGGRDVASVEDVDAALAEHDGASVDVEIWRRERRETSQVVLAGRAGIFPRRPHVEEPSADMEDLRRELRDMRRELDDLRREVDVLRRQR